LLLTQKVIRSLGLDSEIYCFHVAPELRHLLRSCDQYNSAANQVLLIHHCIGHEHEDWINSLQDFKVMVYHNITPAHFFPEDSVPYHYSLLGRQQLKSWAGDFRGAIGDSDYNSAELRAAGYRPVATIPLLVDLDNLWHESWDKAVPERLRDAFNILFVGRIVENKCQHDLVEILHELCQLTDRPVRLILSGGVSSPGYREHLQALIAKNGLESRVEMPGKVSNAQLYGYYRAADAFVCMSEHEGFGMPLVEAMAFDLPVIAWNSSNIAATLGQGGILFREKKHREIAACLKLLDENPGLRRRVIKSQRRNLERFSFDVVRRQLHEFLSSLGLTLPPLAGRPQEKERNLFLHFQIEGPFDSSYSLAAVNRQTALALSDKGEDVGLVSTEGTGDFPPDPEFLRRHPQVAGLWRRTLSNPRPDIVMRNLYPPRTDGMRGETHVMHAYGWEESAFPAPYVTGFNSRLDMLTVMSRYVKKTMQDNGVKVPIAVTGIGADHLLSVSPLPLDIELGRQFRFLHISSCFPRKGVDVLLAAYGRAFSSRDEVSLVIKTFPNPHNDIEQQLHTARAANPDYPDVVLINRDMEEGEMCTLYRQCHALVAPSRGEGYGLPMAEAMLFGLPVITTGYGGQTDFCTPENAWLIDYHFARARTHMGLYDSVWAEPDADHLARLMREVHGSTAEALQAKTDSAKAEILANHKWSDVAERLQTSLLQVEKSPMLHPQPRIGLVSTWNTRCGIATYAKYLFSAIPDEQYRVFASRSAELTEADDARVERCWTAGDADSLDDLYQAVESTGVAALVVQFNFSFFDLAAFSRWIRRVKDLGIVVFLSLHSTADVWRESKIKSLSHIRDDLMQADRLLVHGIDDLNRLKEFGLVDKVVLFPHGVSSPASEEIPDYSSPLRGESKQLIATYGFLLPHKGVRQLIQAFVRLAADDPGLHLLLLNALYPADVSAAEQSACRELIDGSGFADRIVMINEFLADDEVQRQLIKADLIVYPYQHTQESSSAAVRAGLATGRPVAVTPLSIFDDVADVVLSLPGTSPDALAQGIKEFLARPELLEQCVQSQNAWLEAHRWPVLSARLANMLAQPR
jgi:glycosyltransferase involved in cell wall biosynthesis